MISIHKLRDTFLTTYVMYVEGNQLDSLPRIRKVYNNLLELANFKNSLALGIKWI